MRVERILSKEIPFLYKEEVEEGDEIIVLWTGLSKAPEVIVIEEYLAEKESVTIRKTETEEPKPTTEQANPNNIIAT